MPETIQKNEALNEFKRLVEIVAALRAPDGCPWDKEQTQKTLTHYILEEAFELVEAIEGGKQELIQEELGDYLFQVILQAQVAQDEKLFELKDVIKILNEKMVRRHPHVFGNVKMQTSEEVWKKWETLKAQENAQPKPVFSYPRNMPSLSAALKIGHKTEGYQFDWQNAREVLAKLKEEIAELEEVMDQKEATQEHLHEIGDVLFSAAQIARHLKIDPEQSLREANRRFEKRFLKVLELAGNPNKENFAKLSLEEKESLWSKAKTLLKT